VTPRAAGEIGASLVALLLFAACGSAPTGTSPPETAGACSDLAQTFVRVAENRDLGQSRESQIEQATASAQRPGQGDPDATLRYLLQTIDFVYRRPDVSALGIGELVRSGCLVNDEGRAVLYLPQT